MSRLLFVMAISTCALAAPGELRFEAEEWSTPADAWLTNESAADKWTLWSTDIDADQKWSGGVVLRAPTVVEDRARPEDGAPALHTRLTSVPAGVYDVVMSHIVRTLGYSLDGQVWHPIRDEGVVDHHVRIDGTYEIWVDDRFAHPDHPGSGYYDYLLLRRTNAAQKSVGFELGRWLTRLAEVW